MHIAAWFQGFRRGFAPDNEKGRPWPPWLVGCRGYFFAAGAAAELAGWAGSLKLPPDWLAMKIMARVNSKSDRSEAPPLGGMAPLPLVAVATSSFRPWAMRGPQALLSPILGA